MLEAVEAETPCRCEVGLKKDLSEGGEMPPFFIYRAKVVLGEGNPTLRILLSGDTKYRMMIRVWT